MALRRLLPLVFALLLAGLHVSFALPARASVQLAQEDGTENENAEGGEEAEGEGQSDPDAESGANEEQTEEAATEEEGPPWTYQMARISIALILILVAGVGLLYYKLIASRQKGTT
jgi:hypothetical protein